MYALEILGPSSARSALFTAPAEATISSGENISDTTDRTCTLDIERPSSVLRDVVSSLNNVEPSSASSTGFGASAEAQTLSDEKNC